MPQTCYRAKPIDPGSKPRPQGQTATLIKNLKAHKIPTEAYWYQGADHGFLAYTRPIYKPGAAKLSWDRTVAFLRKNLGVGK